VGEKDRNHSHNGEEMFEKHPEQVEHLIGSLAEQAVGGAVHPPNPLTPARRRLKGFSDKSSIAGLTGNWEDL
jgi:hypothetical protein